MYGVKAILKKELSDHFSSYHFICPDRHGESDYGIHGGIEHQAEFRRGGRAEVYLPDVVYVIRGGVFTGGFCGIFRSPDRNDPGI